MTGRRGAPRITWPSPRRSSAKRNRPALEEITPMDPLTLLRELYGEETIRRIVASGFDSVDKIAAATPDSLSFFAGINEALAGQIVGSAADVFAAPAAAGYRHALSGTTESPVKDRKSTRLNSSHQLISYAV